MDQIALTMSQYSLDFLKFLHSDVFELIFQHLSFNDVITASLVSKNYYNTTAASSSCMKKINVIADYAINSHPAENSSKRSYQNISCRSCKDLSSQLIRIIACLGSSWKRIELNDVIFQNNELVELFNNVESTTEELLLSGCISPKVADNRLYEFPKLKSLKLDRCNLPAYQIMSSSSNMILTSVKFELSQLLSDTKQKKNHSLLKKLLINCNKLNDLTLHKWKLAPIFTENAIERMNYKLKYFSTSFDRPKTDIEALNRLLLKHLETLVSLTIDGKIGNVTLGLIFQMPKLKMLKISRLSLSLPINLKLSHSIKKLFLLDKNLPVNHQEKILEHVSCLTSLSIHTINSEAQLSMIDSKCHQLEQLTVAYFWVSNVSSRDYFPNLKQMDIAGDVQYCLEQQIRSKPENEQSRFEKLVLDAI